MNLVKVIDTTFIRFLVVGFANTAIGASIMFIAYNSLGFGYWTSAILNYISGGILSFLLNRCFTFRSRKKVTPQQIFIFVLVVAVSCGVSYTFSYWLLSSVFKFLSTAWQENLSLFVGMILYTVINYFGQKYFVFRTFK